MTPPPALGVRETVAAIDDVVVRAVDLVIDASGEFGAWFSTMAAGLEGDPGAVQRLVQAGGQRDAQLTEGNGALVRMRLDDTLRVVQGIARRHPRRVEAHLRVDERRVAAGGAVPGGVERAAAARQLVRGWMDVDD
ncbi:hypothetical protein [Rhabdothermincola salaria]|uniref:hypothetical protein n=1 Tax=Rhabdothermincola salaria TaxID=2903142 RepID=UPI001E394943|nr:hypothetical protein [Rhabdothermincola salaria]MCD9622453.1 hypothetical protein [Rhabdothermincola salaria]